MFSSENTVKELKSYCGKNDIAISAKDLKADLLEKVTNHISTLSLGKNAPKKMAKKGNVSVTIPALAMPVDKPGYGTIYQPDDFIGQLGLAKIYVSQGYTFSRTDAKHNALKRLKRTVS